MTKRAGRHSWSPAAYRIAGLVISGGAIAGFLAIVLFIKDQGIAYGILYWAISALVLSFVVGGLMDGLRSMLSVVALAVGLFFTFMVFF